MGNITCVPVTLALKAQSWRRAVLCTPRDKGYLPACLLFLAVPFQRIINHHQYPALFSLGTPRMRCGVFKGSPEAQKLNMDHLEQWVFPQ